METSSTWAQYPKRSEDSQQAELCSHRHCAIPYTEKSQVAFKNRFVSSQRSVRLQAVPESPGSQKSGQMVERVCGSLWKIRQGLRQMVTQGDADEQWGMSLHCISGEGINHYPGSLWACLVIKSPESRRRGGGPR